MLTQQFEWFLNGTNQNDQKIEITLDSETVQRIIISCTNNTPTKKVFAKHANTLSNALPNYMNRIVPNTAQI